MNSSRELSATVFALLLPLAASAADFQVIVSDGPTTPATLYVALFDTAEAFTADKPLAAQKVPLRDVKTLLFDAPDTWRAQFDASSAPWKSAFATPKGDRPLTAAKVRGRFPDAVAGTLYRIGPAGHDLGGERNHHWFDDDGMTHRFVIAGSEVHHQGRYVATAKRLAEMRAGRRLTEGFGTVFQGVGEVTSPDSVNLANISVLHVAGELPALWEGGSATRLDLQTLETRGVKTWRADLAGVPFSAHPRVEADGTI